MTDLVSQLVAQLEDMRGKVIELCQTYGNALPHWSLERTDAALTAAKAGGWVAVPVDDFFVLDDDAKAMIVNSHHYTPADILALIERFRSFADPEQTDLADWDNLDWRALCNVTWRVMMGLACDLPPFATPALPDGMALVPVVPTPEMVEAARDVKRQRLVRAAAELKKGKRPDTIGMAMSVNEEWTAMLSARPTTPPKEQA